MLRLVMGLLVVAAAIVLAPVPAHAQSALEVSLTADPAQVVVDLSAGQATPAPSVRYTVVVENLGDDLVSGVELVDELPAGLVHPAGQTVRLTVGELGAHGLWRGEIATTVDHTAAAGQLSNRVVATTGAGERFESQAVTTDVIVISAATIERAPAAPADSQLAAAPPTNVAAAPRPAPRPTPRPASAAPAPAPAQRTRPATQVLGAVFTRGPDGEVVSSLARTGVPLLPLTGAGIGLVLLGAGLLRRSRA